MQGQTWEDPIHAHGLPRLRDRKQGEWPGLSVTAFYPMVLLYLFFVGDFIEEAH